MKAFVIFLFGWSMVWHPAVMGQDSKQQDPKKARKVAMIASLVDSQSYVFKAQTAIPVGGRSRQLTSDYSLTVTPMGLDCYLPYFGRAYSAPIDPSQGRIQFISKDFDYTKTLRKKGGWDITIKPKDARDVQQILFTIFDDGYSTLQVFSISRQQISFNGYIKRIKKK